MISDAFGELHDYLRPAVDDPKDEYYLPPSTRNRRARALAMSALARYPAKPLGVVSGLRWLGHVAAHRVRSSLIGIRIPVGIWRAHIILIVS